MLDSMNGSGTKQDPYQITNGQEFEAVNEDLSAFYELSNDVEFKDSISPINENFDGVFDGRDYEIRGIEIEDMYNSDVGLFYSTTEDAIIRNVGVVDTQINGHEFVGGLVGDNNGRISNSCVKGTVNGHEFVGGLVGWNLGEISDSYFTGTVNGKSRTGGLVGINRGDVSNSYSTGTAKGYEKRIGGLVGDNLGEISNSYSRATVKGKYKLGGIAGHNNGCISCCWGLLEKDEYPLIGYGEADDSVVFGFELCDTPSVEEADLRLDGEDWSMFYSVDTQIIGLRYNEKTYCCLDTSVRKAQELVEGFDQYVVEMSDKFRASVISNI